MFSTKSRCLRSAVVDQALIRCLGPVLVSFSNIGQNNSVPVLFSKLPTFNYFYFTRTFLKAVFWFLSRLGSLSWGTFGNHQLWIFIRFENSQATQRAKSTSSWYNRNWYIFLRIYWDLDCFSIGLFQMYFNKVHTNLYIHSNPSGDKSLQSWLRLESWKMAKPSSFFHAHAGRILLSCSLQLGAKKVNKCTQSKTQMLTQS